VAPVVISVVCLPKMRRGDAAELFLTGARFDGVRAAEVGLITRAVPEAELDAAVAEAIGQLVLGGPQALGAIKRLLTAVPAMERDAAFDWAGALSAQLFASEEATAGIAAFRERRPAPWAGPAET
jgi:methylglutaconyl-CoA hydratase